MDRSSQEDENSYKFQKVDGYKQKSIKWTDYPKRMKILIKSIKTDHPRKMRNKVHKVDGSSKQDEKQSP